MGKGITRYQQYLRLLRQTIKQREDVKAYLELILTLVAVSFFVWFAIRPTFATILTLVKQIEAQKAISQKLDQKLKNLAAISKDKAQFNKDKEVIDDSLPGDISPALTSRQFEAVAREEKINLETLAIGKAIKTKEEMNSGSDLVNTLPVSLTAQGAPEQAISFLTKLENMRRPIVWEKISLSGKPPGRATQLDITASGLIPFLDRVESEEK